MSTFAQSTARISATAARRIASSARTRSVVARAGKQVIATDKAVAALGPYSQAIKVRLWRPCAANRREGAMRERD